MNIRVTFFASLRESLGQDGKTIEAEQNQPLTALQVWQRSTGEDDLPENVLIAKNHEYVPADTLINDGDEVAFFPPVTGG